jgi:hypothetical protein
VSDDADWAIPAPAFRVDEALVTLKRQLRDLRPLVERGSRFEIRGQNVLELAAGPAQIDARLARRPARSTEWVAHAIKSPQDLRRFVEQVKRQLPLWERDE